MQDLMLNEILVRPIVAANTTLLLDAMLFSVDSNNTTEARIQSTSTDNGNEHTVTKFSNESLIATKVSSGTLALLAPSPTNEEEELQQLAFIFLKQ